MGDPGAGDIFLAGDLGPVFDVPVFELALPLLGLFEELNHSRDGGFFGRLAIADAWGHGADHLLGFDLAAEFSEITVSEGRFGAKGYFDGLFMIIARSG